MLKLSKSRLIPLFGVVFFLAVSYGLAWIEAGENTYIIFGVVPAVLCAVLSFNPMHLQKVILIESVLVGLWIAQEFQNDGQELAALYIIMAIFATIIGFKLAELAGSWWQRNVEQDDADSSPSTGA